LQDIELAEVSQELFGAINNAKGWYTQRKPITFVTKGALEQRSTISPPTVVQSFLG
jgi:hypothetical protein